MVPKDEKREREGGGEREREEREKRKMNFIYSVVFVTHVQTPVKTRTLWQTISFLFPRNRFARCRIAPNVLSLLDMTRRGMK